NLGGNMCFGVKMKRDAAFGLSEYAIEAGATPHLWQDRFKGYHYLEADGLDSRLAGNPLVTDWIDTAHLEREVDNGAQYRTPLDSTTADVLGYAYQAYRERVANGTANWQELRRNRNVRPANNDTATTVEMPRITGSQLELPFNVIDSTFAEEKITDETLQDLITPRTNNLGVTPEERIAAENEMWQVIQDLHDNGQVSFSAKDITARFTTRQASWVTKKLKAWTKEGRLAEDTRYGFYRVNV
ncbi:MAG TPA: hypothetical protein VGB67_08525, partial [Fibrella sp.]